MHLEVRKLQHVIATLNLFQGKQPLSRRSKQGVSLVTVLLFMLVATIAATATYKWITSEGHSSSSRMMEREAYQSSVAGIESAISWMTYHANDVGALIQQYKTNGNKAVSLDAQLVELVRPGQNFHVWITGVSTEPYKLKLISEGVARNGKASHSEVAILNVDGLYRVKRPNTKSTINFDKAFFGGTSGLTNSPIVESAIINGNYKGNVPKITKHLIVTGSATLQGATDIAGADMYIKGDISIQGVSKFGAAGNVAYIGGSVTDCAGQKFTAGGDLLVEEDFAAKCGVDVGGNFTIGGTLYRTNDNGDFKVGKNLVFKKDAVLNWTGGKSYTVGVGKNTYLSNIAGKDGSGNRVINLGKAIYLYSSFPSDIKACQNACNKGTGNDWKGTNCYNRCPDENHSHYCEGFFEASKCFIGMYSANVGKAADRYFSFYSTEDAGRVQSEQPVAWREDDGVLKNVSDNYWNKIKNMNDLGNLIDKTSNKVPQPILLKNKDAWINKIQNTFCGLDANGNFTMSDAVVTTLNTCYTTASNDKLYNGFLPIKWLPTNKGDVTSALEHKFIFYVPGTLNQTEIPPTTADGMVFLYLQNGAADIQGHSTCLKSEDESHPCAKNADNSCKKHGPPDKPEEQCILNSAGNRYFTYTYNYLIFSEGENTVAQQGSNVYMQHIPISGSVVMGKTSAGADSKLLTGDIMVDLQYNATVMNAMADADLIMENPDYTALATGKTAGGGGVSGAGAPDDYYIATAPQLSITIESQYANNESIDNIVGDGEAAKGAFIVLPRIIYLSRSPVGTLDQYYNIIPLNSRIPAQNKSVSPVVNPSVVCNGIPASGDLVLTSNHKLTPGNYTCNVTGTVAGTESTVPFFVVVSGDGSATTEVTFAEALKELKKTDGVYDVKLKIPVSTSATSYSVTVTFPDFDADEWSVENKIDGGDDCHKNGVCTFTISSNVATPTIFTVENKGASHQLDFQITGASGCGVGSPYIESIIPSTKIEVERKSLKDWCTITENSGNTLCSRKDDPECDISNEWITASGCSYITKNQKWSCKSTETISLEPVYSGIPDGCDVVIPPDNELQPPFEELETLYASAFSKPFTFTADFSAKTGTEATVSNDQIIRIAVYRKNSFGEYDITPVLTSDCYYKYRNDSENYAKYCQVGVYYGDKVTLTLNPEKPASFNYWMCESGADCPSPKAPDPSYSYTVVVTGDNTVSAHFDEKDKHCFFDEFRDNAKYTNRSQIICSDANTETEYCIGTDGTSKWNLQSGNASDIEFAGDGRISLKSSATRGKKEDSKGSVTIMSTVKAGIYGTLKAQFQVPREEIFSGDISKSTIKQSGFILRSDANVSKYLMLNVFSDRDNKLKARICLNGGTTCSEDVQIGNAEAHQGDIILIAAILKKNKTSGNDELEIQAYTNAYSTSHESHTFELTQEKLNGVQNLASQGNESVGFRLSNQNFKIYGIGWTSEDYRSECWDTTPIIRCSFKAAFAGGVVPKGKENVKPWVGFSKWFDDNGGSCAPIYYYNGSDAGCAGGTVGSDYQICTSGYTFSTEGVHGVNDTKVARVGTNASSCNIFGEKAPWVNSVDDPPDIAAHCGAFWVGLQSPCKKHAKFELAVNNGAEGKYFGIKPPDQGSYSLPIVANLRQAELIVEMDNTSGSEVEIYLFSNNADLGGSYGYGTDYVYSMPYTTNASGTGVKVTIDVDAISHVEGFDPERVVGVYVKGESVNVTSVRSNCPNALGIAGCSASYDPANDKWSITATVNGIEDAGTLNVPSVKIGGSTTKTVSGALKTCNKEPSDCVSGKTQTWEVIWGSDQDDGLPYISDTHTPYYYLGSNTSVNYVFTVELTDENGDVAEGSPCTKATDGVSKITATCEKLSKTKVNQGQGIPQLQYSITGCPAAGTAQNKKCGYEVNLYKGSTKKTTVFSKDNLFGNVSKEWSGDADINKGTALEVGDDYKLVLESTNSEFPFAGCGTEFSFEVKETGAQSDEYQADCWWEINGTEVTTVIEKHPYATFKARAKKGFDAQKSVKLVFNDKETSFTLNAVGGDAAGISNYSYIPDATNSPYDYNVVYEGENICNGTNNSLTVVKALSCSVRNDVEIGVENYFDVTKNSIAGNCWSCSGGVIGANAFTINDAQPRTFNISCTCDNAPASCSATATAVIQAPEISCSSTAIDVEPSTNIVAPVSIEHCEAGCSYNIISDETDVKVSGTADPSTNNATSVTFTGENLQERNTPYEYKITVSNTEGSDDCKIKVNYKKPSYSCPDAITAEPGTQVTVTPVLGSPSYCSGGCDYKITGTGIDDIEGENFTSGSLADKIVDASNPITGTDVTGGVAKKYSLTLSNAAGSGTACDVTVNYMKPTFTCPTNISDQSVDAEVEVTLDGINYCTNGCSYTITGGKFVDNTSAGDLTATSGGSKAIKKIKGEANASTGDGTEYTLTLHNPAGDNVEECKFKVKYTEEPVELCNCEDYCTKAQCADLRVSGDLRFDGNCYFATSISVMNGDTYTINKKTYSGWKNSGFPAPVDGGYYITSTGRNDGCTVTLGKPNPECSSYHVCQKKTCIPWVNCTGGYTTNCYSSGLSNQAAGKCYNAKSEATCINNNAQDASWWKEVDCNNFCI